MEKDTRRGVVERWKGKGRERREDGGWGPTAREKDKDGRRRRHRKGGVKGGEGG